MTHVSPAFRSPLYARSVGVFLALFGLGCGTSMSLLSSAAFFLGLCVAAELVVGAARSGLALKVGLLYTLYLVAQITLLSGPQALGPNAGYLFAGLLFYYPLSRLRPKLAPSLWRVAYVLTALGSALAVVFAFWQRLHGEARVYGQMRNPVIFAYGLLPALVFFAVTRNSLRDKALALALFVAILLSGTRMAALVGGGVLVFAFLPLLLRPGRRAIAASLLALTVAIGARQMSGPDGLWDRAARVIKDGGSGDKSVSGRREIWKLNWAQFADHPLFGVGYRANTLEIDQYPQLQGVLAPGSKGIFAHNLFLQTLAESGLVGFALLFGFQLLAFLTLPVLRPYFLVLWVAGLSDTPLSAPRMYYPFFFFMILAVFAREALESKHAT